MTELKPVVIKMKYIGEETKDSKPGKKYTLTVNGEFRFPFAMTKGKRRVFVKEYFTEEEFEKDWQLL